MIDHHLQEGRNRQGRDPMVGVTGRLTVYHRYIYLACVRRFQVGYNAVVVVVVHKDPIKRDLCAPSPRRLYENSIPGPRGTVFADEGVRHEELGISTRHKRNATRVSGVEAFDPTLLDVQGT